MDIELVELMSKGSEPAFLEIYHRYKGILYQFAYRRLQDQLEVDDIIQELFATLWVKRETLDLKTNVSGYLYAAVRNRILDIIAHKQVESVYIQSLQEFVDHGNAITDHRLRQNMLQELIEKEVANLPKKMREVFELSRKYHLSHKEISEKLEISEKTVKNQINNALKILRVKLGLLIYLYLLTKYR